jgi:hypothetical protein
MFTRVKKPTPDTAKEVIFEISAKIDDLNIQMKRSQNQLNMSQSNISMYQPSQFDNQRASSQESADNARSQLNQRGESPNAQSMINLNNQKKSPFGKQMINSNSQENLSNYASTADVTLILDEREKRLQVKEEMFKYKE